MARRPSADPIYALAAQFRERCLLGERSLLWSETPAWTAVNVKALRDAFMDNPDEGDRSFFEKWEDQLRKSPPAIHRVAADLMALYCLFPTMGAARKAELVDTVIGWKLAATPPEVALTAAFARGIGDPGLGYQAYRPWILAFILELVEEGKRTGIDWADASVVQPLAHRVSKRVTRCAAARNVLLHLLFPEDYERIASDDHKQLILKRYPELAGDASDQDDGLARVRHALGQRLGRPSFDFYEPELLAEWNPGDGEKKSVDPKTVGKASISKPAPVPAFTGRTWLLAPGEGARQWEEFAAQDIGAIGWDELGDLRGYASLEAMKTRLRELRGVDAAEPTHDSAACWAFVHDMQPGDEVFAKKGRSLIVGRGLVTSDYEYRPERAEYWNVRRIQWLERGEWHVGENRLVTKTLTRIDQFPELMSEIRAAVQPVPPEPGIARPFTLDDAVRDLFIDRAEMARRLALLQERRNVVLEGPPGTGKTLAARRLAQLLLGEHGDDRLEQVQFHQSYGYEDFVQGWRHDSNGRLTRRDGIFLRVCERARRDPRPHVVLIDEINRGNLARIFGELMMLLESDKRGPDWRVSLAYSDAGEKFFIPENVYVIGTMNSADRSLALVDYALRRRFAFFRLDPAYDSIAFRSHLVEKLAVESGLCDRIISRMNALNARIAKDARQLGPDFRIGHSYFCRTGAEGSCDASWFRRIVDHELAPLLREYWPDGSETAESELDALRVDVA